MCRSCRPCFNGNTLCWSTASRRISQTDAKIMWTNPSSRMKIVDRSPAAGRLSLWRFRQVGMSSSEAREHVESTDLARSATRPNGSGSSHRKLARRAGRQPIYFRPSTDGIEVTAPSCGVTCWFSGAGLTDEQIAGFFPGGRKASPSEPDGSTVRVYLNRQEGSMWWAADDLGFTGWRRPALRSR